MSISPATSSTESGNCVYLAHVKRKMMKFPTITWRKLSEDMLMISRIIPTNKLTKNISILFSLDTKTAKHKRINCNANLRDASVCGLSRLDQLLLMKPSNDTAMIHTNCARLSTLDLETKDPGSKGTAAMKNPTVKHVFESALIVKRIFLSCCTRICCATCKAIASGSSPSTSASEMKARRRRMTPRAFLTITVAILLASGGPREKTDRRMTSKLLATKMDNIAI
mmetsp:Transcript_51359/g.148254  ORF Transcript_51359/g.148254 Transcript_51359/m.148254 type:complete len:225 (+) Transcript_51359:1020-1694(+)